MKKYLTLLLILIAFIYVPVNAKVDNFMAGGNVTFDKDVTKTSFIAGNDVEVNSRINGIGFVAGNRVSVSGSEDYLFAAGNSLSIDKVTTKDMFLAGNNIVVKDSNVRDLYAAASFIRIESRVSNNLYLGGDHVYINSEIDGDAYVAGDTIRIGDQAVIHGTLNYPKESKITISKTAIIKEKKAYKGEKVEVNKTSPIISNIVSTIISFVSMLLIAFVLYAISKKLFKEFIKTKTKADSLLKTIGIGLITLIVVPVLSFFVMLTLIGIPLSVLVLMLYGVLIYLSIIPTSYYLGNLFLKDKIKNAYLLIFVSLLCMYILKSIPYLGWIIEFLSIGFGLGIFVSMIKEKIKTKETR